MGTEESDAGTVMGTEESDAGTAGGRVLRGQVAVVTGASRGIGLAVAERLTGEGADVALLARSHHEVAEAATALNRGGVRAIGLGADVTRGADVDAAFQAVRDRLGPPTLVVNNAGLFSAVGPVWEVDPEAWWRDVEVSVRGTFLCSRAALRSMVPGGGGRILNMTSLSGTRPSPHATGYACAKAGVFRLTEGLAEEAGPYGVQVFSIGPGWVRTAMTEEIIETDQGRWLPEMLAVPADDWVGPERVADLVVLIATGRADALSGRFLHALDDVNALIRRADEIRREDLYTVRLRR